LISRDLQHVLRQRRAGRNTLEEGPAILLGSAEHLRHDLALIRALTEEIAQRAAYREVDDLCGHEQRLCNPNSSSRDGLLSLRGAEA